MLPTIKLGNLEVTRLIIGGNPFSGNSHISPEKDEEMEEYFTVENIKRTLFRCEECGLNTMQMRGDKHIFRIVREYRQEGGKMHWIAQTASEMLSFEGNVRQIIKYGADAIYHHGTLTDALFKAGEYQELKDRLTILRDTGLPVGLGTHMPEVIEYSEEHGWDIDFYIASVHNLSKVDRVSSAVTGKANQGESFDEEDRELMFRTIRATPKPCFAIKILASGRKCNTSEEVKQAFVEAFTGIKPIDAVIVGMFPKTKDQVYENARLVEEILSG